MKPISIVVITLNEEKRIARLLTDLSKQSYQNFEVILVDSNSDDHTVAVAEKFAPTLPSLTTHVMTTRGVSLGRNTGAKLAKHSTLLFLDADVRLDSNFLSRSVAKLVDEQLEVAGVYMGASRLPFHYKLGYFAFNAGLFATQFFFPTAVGACIFSSKRVHEEIGGFDEEIILCEDCHYVKKAAKTWRFRMIPTAFEFDPRRLEQDGIAKMGLTYLKANVRRFFMGEMRNNEIEYPFDHYQKQ
ncbi:glycosyltransferase [Vibrio hippocampi]|uniref:Glycosyltransferase 2-like domain-containing protein n=1 Tax=Vibrio hippocampi TaxID=654686 RepID=A0ABM8ZN98_9VIBR|nr:glycosyltransferase [Vibrio hippocampi]CAH0530067.1 hypothetical protein VHP8226_03795 [Vibrio hippocampi]